MLPACLWRSTWISKYEPILCSCCLWGSFHSGQHCLALTFSSYLWEDKKIFRAETTLCLHSQFGFLHGAWCVRSCYQVRCNTIFPVHFRLTVVRRVLVVLRGLRNEGKHVTHTKYHFITTWTRWGSSSQETDIKAEEIWKNSLENSIIVIYLYFAGTWGESLRSK